MDGTVIVALVMVSLYVGAMIKFRRDSPRRLSPTRAPDRRRAGVEGSHNDVGVPSSPESGDCDVPHHHHAHHHDLGSGHLGFSGREGGFGGHDGGFGGHHG